jgi:hypothetical protein
MLGRDKINFETFAGAHILPNVMTGRSLDLLTKENVHLGMEISEKRKKVDENDQGIQTMSTEETNTLGAFAEKSDLKVPGSESWVQQIKINETLIQAISTSEKSRITSMIGARRGYPTKAGKKTLIRLLERCYVIGSYLPARQDLRLVRTCVRCGGARHQTKLPTFTLKGGDSSHIN